MKKTFGPELAWAVAIVTVGLAATLARKLGYIDGNAVARIFGVVGGLYILWLVVGAWRQGGAQSVNGAVKKTLSPDLVWVGAIVGATVVATFAKKLGYIDGDAVTRICGIACGLYILWLGDRMPKIVAPNAIVLQVARFGGWSFVLSALVYISLWAFAPLPAAAILGGVTALMGVAAPIGYAVWLRTKSKVA